MPWGVPASGVGTPPYLDLIDSTRSRIIKLSYATNREEHQLSAIISELPREVTVKNHGTVPAAAVVSRLVRKFEAEGYRRYCDALIQIGLTPRVLSAPNARRLMRLEAGEAMLKMARRLPAIQRANMEATARSLAAPEAGPVVRFITNEVRLRLPVATEYETRGLEARLAPYRDARHDAAEALPGILAMFPPGPVSMMRVANVYYLCGPVLSEGWPSAASAGRGTLGDLLEENYEIIGQGSRRMVVVPEAAG